jgi:hypothetical protein
LSKEKHVISCVQLRISLAITIAISTAKQTYLWPSNASADSTETIDWIDIKVLRRCHGDA